jgi:hypothetical protein
MSRNSESQSNVAGGVVVEAGLDKIKRSTID